MIWTEAQGASPFDYLSRLLSRAGVAIDRMLTRLLIKDAPVKPRRITATMIVCGDCAGRAANPRKTMLAVDALSGESCCADCGGRSYVLASKMRARLEVEG